MDDEVIRRLGLILKKHQPDGPADVYWGCAAHSEGQWCCLDALTDDTAWADMQTRLAAD